MTYFVKIAKDKERGYEKVSYNLINICVGDTWERGFSFLL